MKFAVRSLPATSTWLCLALLCVGVGIYRRSHHIAPNAARAVTPQLAESYGKLPLSFEANQGQADAAIKFLARGYGYDLALTAAGASLNLQGAQKQARVQMRLVNARPPKRISGAAALPGKVNYLLGDDAKQWRTDVPTYAKVKCEAVYQGVDVVWYGNQQQLEYDFVVAPGADPQQIKLAFNGAQRLRLDASGDLIVETEAGELRQHRPVIYQEVNGQRQTVSSGYRLANANQVTFAFGAYDANRPLVLDPVLSYSTLLASGNVGDSAFDVAVDAAGNAYLTGSVLWDEGFPTTPGALRFVPDAQTLASQPVFAFVTKFNPQGNQLVYSTLIGGTRGIPYPGTNRTEYYSSSRGRALALDAAGNIFVTGETASANFPTTPDAFKTSYNGAPVPPRTQSPVFDAFVLKLNATGSALLYSTLLGGNLNELSAAIAVDAAGNAHVTGYTESRNFPTTPGAFQPQSLDDPLAFTSDGFAVKLNATGSALLYATFLGSGSNDRSSDLALDAAGNAYITGWTFDGARGAQFSDAAKFPVTPGAFQGPKTETASANAFLVKLNSTGNAVYSARLGPIGPADEVATGIAIDAAGQAYVTGQTHSQLYPTTPGAYRRTGVSDNPLNTITGGFVTKVAPDGRSLVFSTLLGEPNERPNPYPKRPYDIAVDAVGNVYIVGAGYALPGFAFVEKLNPTGSVLLYSYQFPVGQGEALTLDGQGGVYFTGGAWEGFVTTPGAYRQRFDNSPFFKRGAFLAKISENSTNGLPLPLSSASPSPTVSPSPTPSGTPRPLFTVSGRVTSLTGQPIAGASVYLNALVQLTDTNGNYSFPNQAGGSEYLLSALKDGLSYFPEGLRFPDLNSNRTANFTQIPVTSGALHTSAATYDGNELAPGSIISAFGANLATSTQVATTTPLPATLAGTRVLVLDRNGVERTAPLFFVSPTQINYLLPPETAAEAGGDQALVRIINSANQVFAARFEVAPVVPGFFTADASGRGLVAAVALRVRANGAQSYEPIARWDAAQSRMVAVPLDLGAATEQVFLICFGTGFRRLAAGNTTAAQLGGVTTPISFAGPQGSLDGLDQLNLPVPRGLAGRGEVQLAFSVDGNNANPVKVVIK